jgi:hypothetical protein
VSVLSAGKVYEVCPDAEQGLNEGVSICENVHRGGVVSRCIELVGKENELELVFRDKLLIDHAFEIYIACGKLPYAILRKFEEFNQAKEWLLVTSVELPSADI